MTVLKRDTHYHTYGDYLTWSRTYGDELIDGTAYVREPPSPSWSHQEMVVELGNRLDGRPAQGRYDFLSKQLQAAYGSVV